MKWPLRLAVAMLLVGLVTAGAIAWSPARTKSGATCGSALKVVLKSRQRSDSAPSASQADQSSASGTECEAAAELQLARAAGIGGVFVMTPWNCRRTMMAAPGPRQSLPAIALW